MFKSKFEEEISNFYNIGDVYESEKITYTLINNYTPDFIFGNTILECKGFFKPSDRRKMLEVIKQYPNKKFIMFFQDSTVKISKKSKTTYGDWCSKNNIEWYCWKTKRPTKKLFKMVIKNG